MLSVMYNSLIALCAACESNKAHEDSEQEPCFGEVSCPFILCQAYVSDFSNLQCKGSSLLLFFALLKALVFHKKNTFS